MSSLKTLRSLSGTDALGREVTPVASLSESRQVGMFYFLWTGEHGSTGASKDGHILDISKLNVSEIKSSSDIGRHHCWDEPLYGYYRSDDPWVFRKHLELFALAGVDYLVFDYTNSWGSGYAASTTIIKTSRTFVPVALEMQNQGWISEICVYAQQYFG
ncbi:MAG: hypothetical protein ACLRSW_10055 [Christensenellaceae bacterium]